MGISDKNLTKGVALGGNVQQGMKKIIGSLTGAAVNSFEKDRAAFLLYLIYKYYIYVPPTGWFSFSWTPLYWIGIGIFAMTYLGYVTTFWGAGR